jgi:hypothetical protein
MAITKDWTIYVYNSNTLAWDSDYALERPNDVLNTPVLHNQQKFQLADGSYAFMSPETKSTKDDVTFVWIHKDQTFKDLLEAYVTNDDYLKITTHNGTIQFIGRFVSITPIWAVGIDGDYFDISAVFQIME